VITFERHPSRYRHWRLEVRPPLATLSLAVDPDGAQDGDYALKLNSYDLGVDIELADAVQRLRFEHPDVRCVVLTGGLGEGQPFCSGANIRMLGSAGHPFKVNFCKLTNETRLAMEDAAATSSPWPVGTSSWSTTATRPCRCPRCRYWASCPGPVGSHA
jgi:benzoyl-CoA-dihydrodiol lyase